MQVVVDQRQAFKLTHNVGQLHAVAFEELATSREVAEYVAHHDICATVAHAWLLAFDLGAVDFQASAEAVILSACAQFDL